MATEGWTRDGDLAALMSIWLPSSAPGKRPRQTSSSQSANPNNQHIISNLGDDLLVEILIRLPNPRSSCRCKAVCKRWSSLISDPTFNRRFISHHQSRRLNQPRSLFLRPDDDPGQSFLSFLPAPDEARPNLRALDCFKDLLLCGFVGKKEVFNHAELGRSYLLCNPFSKQWIALPLAPSMIDNGSKATRLVCQPRCCSSSSSSSESEAEFVYSEYRFCVVCISQCEFNVTLDVFCSESGKWTQAVRSNAVKWPSFNVVAWNGELFWMHHDRRLQELKLAAHDPFRPDHISRRGHDDDDPISIPSELWNLLSKGGCGNISVSQGALHIILLEYDSFWRGNTRNALTVWRLEEDHKTWSKQYEMALKKTGTMSTPLWCDYKLDKCFIVGLHPEKPEIVFLKYLDSVILSCNLRTGTGEPEFFSDVNNYAPSWSCNGWRAMQPRVSCWDTPIPRYEDLQSTYDGSYDCFIQRRSAAQGSHTSTQAALCCVEKEKKVVKARRVFSLKGHLDWMVQL